MIEAHRSTRVLVDRSALHGSRFEDLAHTQLINLVRSGLCEVYYSTPFIEETLRLMFSKRDAFIRQWDYLCLLNPERWFRPPLEIVAEEFNPARTGTYPFRLQSEIEEEIANTRKLFDGRIGGREVENALAITQAQKTRNLNFRQTRLNLRAHAKWKKSDFEEFFEQNVDKYMREVVFHSETDSRIAQWHENRSEYPFTSALAKNMLAMLFLPICDHSLKVDANDKSDAEQVAYLELADIMVSDDTRFVKSCFDLVFGHTQKRLISSREFNSFIEGSLFQPES